MAAFADIYCIRRQAFACCIDGSAAGQYVIVVKGVSVFFADLVEDFNGFGHHFRTDPIAFDYGYIVIHIFLHLLVFFLSGGDG